MGQSIFTLKHAVSLRLSLSWGLCSNSPRVFYRMLVYVVSHEYRALPRQTHTHTHTQGKTNTSARRLFLGSLVYLPLLLACMVFHRSGEAAAAPYHPVFK